MRHEVRIQAKSAKGRVMVEVSDDGPGLTPQEREHLFEPFFTTKSTGHGLGLAVSRELARSMGADLRYREAHAGATFVLDMRGADGASRNDLDRRG